MPDPTDVSTQEFIVTGQVNSTYEGQGYTEYSYNGDTYRTYNNDLNTRWVDADSDGWFDYGRRDEGFGDWSTWDGFKWTRDSDKPGDGDMETTNNIAQPDGDLTGLNSSDIFVFQTTNPHHPDPSLGSVEPSLTLDSGDWFF